MDEFKGLDRRVGGYMTVEAALVMSVVIMVYVFLIDTMIFQYERCVNELEQARYAVLRMDEKNTLYDVKEINPVSILRLQRILTK